MMLRKIYLLRLIQVEGSMLPRYDIYLGHVIVANSEDEARSMCKYADEGDIWIDKNKAICEVIGYTDRKEGIVLSSFNAG